MMFDSTVNVILFDLGGVLIELDGPPIKPEWLNKTLSHEENWRMWMNSSYVKAFETGAIAADTFIDGVVDELCLNVTKEAFREAFVRWPKDLFPGAAELLLTLKKHFILAFFSNTSELHLPRLLHQLHLADYFHHTYASYEIGYFKPDTNGFDYVVNDMGVLSNKVLFIDDNQVNVDAALQCGLQAEKAFGLEEVKSVLHRYACL